MFDVSWADPAQETVAERRSRKEREQLESPRGRSATVLSNSNASTTTRSSTSSSFRDFWGERRSSQSRRPSSVASGSGRENATLSSRRSKPNLKSISSISSIPESMDSKVSRHGHAPLTSHPPLFRKRSAIFKLGSRTDASSPKEHLMKSHMIQPLSPHSYITQTTEVTVFQSPEEMPASQSSTETSITAGCIKEEPDEFVEELSGMVNKLQVEKKTTRVTEPITYLPKWAPPDEWRIKPRSDVAMISPPASPERTPEAFLETTKPAASPSSSIDAPKLTAVQRRARAMAKVDSRITLQRLKEPQWTSADPETVAEMEFDRQLWIFTALRSLQQGLSDGAKGSSSVKAVKSEDGQDKTLLLFESKASASFISSENPAAEYHHVSPDPVLTETITGVWPLQLSSPQPPLPYPSCIFTSIYCMNLAILFKSSSIPEVLEDCNRLLSASGSLHLTLLDPAPSSTTCGPKLRRWIDDNLIINLERKFICSSPSRLVPLWLEDAGFKFNNGHGHIQQLTFPATDAPDAEHNIQISTVVGRLLWKQMWGDFVNCKKMWWEEQEIREECEALGTVWNYQLVEAVIL